MPEDPEVNGLICPYCEQFLDTLTVRECPACGNLFCDDDCFNGHFTMGYHLGDDYYNDHKPRKLLHPHDFTYMPVPYSSTKAWVPALELEDDE